MGVRSREGLCAVAWLSAQFPAPLKGRGELREKPMTHVEPLADRTPDPGGQSLRSRTLWTLWSEPLRRMRLARPRVGATFSTRLGRLMVRQSCRA